MFDWEKPGQLPRSRSVYPGRIVFLLGMILLNGPGQVFSQELQAEVLTEFYYNMDTLWVLVASCLVFFMQAGFSLLEAGLHSAKNCVHILMKNFFDFLIACLGFWAIGFAFMFGKGNSIIGLEGFFLQDKGGSFDSLSWASLSLEAKFFFQLVFAGTAATIVSGAIGGRFKFTSYLLFSLIMTTFIYPIMGHWVWGGGWLAENGFFDFAGSTVVHGVGGWAALAGAYYVGPRLMRFESEYQNPYPPHNMSLVGLGIFILWLGWFGFNPGSTMNISKSADLVSHIFLTTNIAAAAGSLFACFCAYYMVQKYDAAAMFNGLLGGLVSITASCAFVSVRDAFIIGGIGGLLVLLGNIILERLKIDDVVGAWPVHGLCGVWGTLAVGLFANTPWAGGEGLPKVGLFYGGGFGQLWVQFYGTVIVCLCSFLLAFGVFFVLKMLIGIRENEIIELDGSDLHEHGYKAYLGTDLLDKADMPPAVDEILQGLGDHEDENENEDEYEEDRRNIFR